MKLSLRSSGSMRYGSRHDHPTRQRSIRIENRTRKEGLHKLDRSPRQGRIRNILPLWEKSSCESRGVAVFGGADSKGHAHWAHLPKSAVRESTAFEDRNPCAKRIGKQRFDYRYKRSKDALPRRASFRQIIPIQTREGSILLNLPSRKTEADSDQSSGRIGGRHIATGTFVRLM